MSDLSTYLGDALLNWIKSTAFPSDPAAVYAALYNGDPESGGTEVTGTINLTRQAITFGSIAARAMANSGEINFGTSNNTGTVTYVAIMDASSSGNILTKKSITSASIANGEKVSIANGALSLTY